MNISFLCDRCGLPSTINAGAAGTTIDCPNCGKPAYVPSATKTGTPDSPLRIAVGTAQPQSVPSVAGQTSPPAEASKVHPAIVASVCCLLVTTLALLVGLLLDRQLPGAGMIAAALVMPFLCGAMLCAIYGMCHGQIKSGLLLLGGVSLMLVLFVGSLGVTKLHALSKGAGDLPQQTQELQQQLEKMLQQLSQ